MEPPVRPASQNRINDQIRAPKVRLVDENGGQVGIKQTAEALEYAYSKGLDLVEKPSVSEAPSDLAIIGRYILTPDIFPALAKTKSDRTGEIQLTNGLRELLKTRPIYACEVRGVRHDTGNKLGFLKAVVYFALRRPDLADKFTAYLASLGIPEKTNV